MTTLSVPALASRAELEQKAAALTPCSWASCQSKGQLWIMPLVSQKNTATNIWGKTPPKNGRRLNTVETGAKLERRAKALTSTCRARLGTRADVGTLTGLAGSSSSEARSDWPRLLLLTAARLGMRSEAELARRGGRRTGPARYDLTEAI